MVSYNNYTIKNNVFGTLSAPISSLATTIQLGDGQGARFSVNQLATLENIENGKVMKREIVLITAINGDVLTVTRKVAPCPANDDANTQGQVSYAFSADDTISAYITKEHFDKIDDSINDIYDNGVNKLRTEVVSGLQIKVNAGPVLVGSGYYDFAGGNLTLTDNAINYVEIDQDGLLVSNTTDRGDKNTKISKVTTSGGEITKIEDWRLGTVGGEIGGVNIHDLTEKTILSPDDEFIVADSDNIYNNKKVKFGHIQPATLVRNVTLGEAVTAGDGYGACYIGLDGKAYNSNPAGHNYCDGIVIDSGSAGDTVRMVISGFVPCSSLNGTLGTVHLAYTSDTTNTGYADYVKFTGVNTTNNRVYDGTYVTVGGVQSGIVVMGQYGGASTPFIHPLYGVSGAITTTGRGQGATVYYITGAPGQYNNTASYGISGCELGKVVPGGFMFDPKPVEYMVGFGKEISGSGNNLGTTTGILSNFDGEKTFAITWGGYAAFQIEIQESPDNTNFYSIGGLNSESQSTNYHGNGSNMYSRIKVKKGYYYRYYGSASYQIIGHVGIMAQK